MLFEALISAIHPEDVTPEGDNLTQLSPHDLLKQEKTLYHRFIEFTLTPHLAALLNLSQFGMTEQFVEFFNEIKEGEYSKHKLSLYDINQRKFIIDNSTHPRKAFLVHYNGYVFGTNHAKMFTIREREIGLHQELPPE